MAQDDDDNNNNKTMSNVIPEMILTHKVGWVIVAV